MASGRRILGIDPGSRVTGYAVIDSDGRHSRHVESGCIRLAPEQEMSMRLGEIFQAITGLVYIPVSLFQMIWMIRRPDGATPGSPPPVSTHCPIM